jgi:hypothetical protein
VEEQPVDGPISGNKPLYRVYPGRERMNAVQLYALQDNKRASQIIDVCLGGRVDAIYLKGPAFAQDQVKATRL